MEINFGKDLMPTGRYQFSNQQIWDLTSYIDDIQKDRSDNYIVIPLFKG